MQRRLAAILAADVVGYSRLMAADEFGTLAHLSAHRNELIEPKTAEYHGRVVKLMGDGTLMEFGSVIDAVNFAVDIQNAMAERNVGVSEESQIIYRIGINIGDIIVDGDDIYGDGVNVAARLEQLADPGGICIANNVYNQVRNKVEVSFRDMGEQNLKNMPEPVRVYRIAVRDEDDQVATINKAEPLHISDNPSIAVLPFVNMSGDPEQEYFADGLTEDLITMLSQWHSFPVIARNSTFTYKGHAVDIRRASQELGAHYIVEGSVRRSGNRIRVAVQLIEGSSGHHLWAETLDRELEDIFELQDDLAQRIAATVMPELERSSYAAQASGTHQHLNAWGLLHKGVAQIYEHHPEGFAKAREILRQAIGVDPGYARAYAWIAYSYFRDVLVGSVAPSDEIWCKAIAAARRAVELDDLDGQAHHVLGLVYFRMGEHDLALAEQQRAMELNPSSVYANVGLGQVLAHVGRTEEGIVILERALQLNPRDPRRWNHLDIVAVAHITAGTFERAAELARDSIHRRPDNARSHLYLAVALGNLGQIDEAQSELAAAQELDSDVVWKNESMRSHKYSEDNENFLEGLRKASLPVQS